MLHAEGQRRAREVSERPEPARSPCRASDYKALGNVTSYTLTCQMNGNKSVSAVTAIYDASMIHGRITNADGNVSTFVNSRIGNCGWSPFGN